MAATTIAAALPGLKSSLESAIPALPDTDAIKPAENGITLLDAKNEIFLAYLQTLALRNLAVIRSVRQHVSSKDDGAASAAQALDDELVKDLVKHRVYLEKGIRPLEERLKYQIDKVLRAVDDEIRAEQRKSAPATNGKKTAKTAKTATDNDDDSASGSDDGDDDDKEDEADEEEEVDELSYRPNPLAFRSVPGTSASTAAPQPSAREAAMAEDGIYRPPRISATSMPTTERKEEKAARPMRSATMDEYIAAELSTAPAEQPSIGSTIAEGGRRDKSARERKDEAERREYEESNLVRLPKESKKVRAQKAHRERGAFGGEEWRGIGDGLDRIERLTRKKSGSSGGASGALERSRKRKATEDGPRGEGGADMGGAFEKRKKRTMRRM